MKKFYAIFLTALVVIVTTAQAEDTAPLRWVQTIPMPGVKGRIDHLAIDRKGERLFVAALGNNTLEILDLRMGKRIDAIGRLHEPQGVMFIPEFNKLLVTNRRGGTLKIFDGDRFNLMGSVRFSDDADNIRYDAATKSIYVGYGDGALGILDAKDGKQLDDIKLAGHPESFQLERCHGREFSRISRQPTI